MAITVGYGYDRYGIVGKGGRGGGEEKKEESAKSERFFVETGVNSAEREKCRGMNVEWKVAGKSLRVSINKPCMVMYSRPSR